MNNDYICKTCKHCVTLETFDVCKKRKVNYGRVVRPKVSCELYMDKTCKNKEE